MRVLGFLCAAWSASPSFAADPESGAGGVVVEFPGSSGKFRVYRATNKQETQVEIEVDEVAEVKADGSTTVNAHRITTMASQAYTYTEDDTESVGDVSAKRISLKTNLAKGQTTFGRLQVDTFLMTASGEVGPNASDPDSERWSVEAGSLKFNIVLDNWNWASDGEFVDVKLTLKSFGAQAKKGSGNKYDLGGGSSMDLTTDVSLDDVGSTMPTGYPKLEIVGNKQRFIFRFPKFTGVAAYDPVVTLGGSGEGDAAGAQGLLALTALAFPLLCANAA